MSVKYNCVHNPSLHNNISINQATPLIFSILSSRQKNPKRQMMKSDQLTYTHDVPTEETGPDGDNISSTEKQIDELCYGDHHNKRCGWRR
eukprot:9010679-Ditylum_brightwellii.AAC.1